MIFRLYLEKQKDKFNIQFIGEEWSSELLAENAIKTTVPQDVATYYQIDHSFCDPSQKEREMIGYKSKVDNYIREQFWLDKIKSIANKNIVFICGTDHLDSFKQLLIDSGYQVEIVPKRFDLNSYAASQN